MISCVKKEIRVTYHFQNEHGSDWQIPFVLRQKLLMLNFVQSVDLETEADTDDYIWHDHFINVEILNDEEMNATRLAEVEKIITDILNE
jgi:hypothetical protein